MIDGIVGCSHLSLGTQMSGQRFGSTAGRAAVKRELPTAAHTTMEESFKASSIADLSTTSPRPSPTGCDARLHANPLQRRYK